MATQRENSSPTYKKLRGGYYTPQPIADFLSSWAIRSSNDEVLEPSCGDGNILIAVALTLAKRGATFNIISNLLHGVEIDPYETVKARERLLALGISLADHNIIHRGDFFAHCREDLQPDKRFDVVIGNPPFIRYQHFPEKHRQIAFSMMRQAGLHPNRLTNAWLPFLVMGSLLLKEDGRLAMVIPAELFQVNYAAEVRQFLSDYFSKVTLVTFR